MVSLAQKIGTRSDDQRAVDIDRHVSLRIRERRIVLGLTLQQAADLLGVTYAQFQKYEKGINRIAAGRLYNIAQALDIDVSYFFEGLHSSDGTLKATPQQRMLLELARNFLTIEDRSRQEEVCALVRALAQRDHGAGEASNPPTSEITTLVKFIEKLTGTWAIDEQEVARLLGLEDEKAFSDLLSGAATLSTRDMKDRVRHLLRMREALHSLFRDTDAEREWLREPRPELNGQSPLALLLEGSMENLLVVSQFVQWMVGR
jgi:transcriptional regulator with XRE-family HTH domain